VLRGVPRFGLRSRRSGLFSILLLGAFSRPRAEPLIGGELVAIWWFPWYRDLNLVALVVSRVAPA